MPQTPVPPLRTDLDLVPIEHDGRAMVLVRDPLDLVPGDRVFSLDILRIINSLPPGAVHGDFQNALTRAGGGQTVGLDQVRELVQGLDQFHLLESESLIQARRAVVDQWQGLEVRPAALAGSAYPEDAGELSVWAADIVALSGTYEPRGRLACLVAPHIDPQAGAAVYGAAYGALAAMPEAERPGRVVVLGTGHNMVHGLVSLCAKDFQTPLGRMATDRAAVDRLARAAGQSLAPDDFTHRSEHSVEFQAVFMHHLFGPDAPALVPALFGSGHGLPEYSRQAFLDALGPFCEELAGLMADKDTLLLVGADLCHIGPKFGHTLPASDLAPGATAHEKRLLDAMTGLDPESLWDESVLVDNQYHVCSFLSLAVAVEAVRILGGVEGRLLDRGLWREELTNSAVGFAALAFERT